MLSPEAIDEFKKLFYQEYKIKLNSAQAIDIGTRLIRLVKIVFGSNTPKKWRPKKIDTNYPKG